MKEKKNDNFEQSEQQEKKRTQLTSVLTVAV